jgi:glutamate--cysteine ligase
MVQFMNEGFAKASIAKIAKLADVSPATIYIYFENKEDLIVKLYLHLRKSMSEVILSDISLDGCLEAAYKRIWKNYFNYCITNHKEFDYMMQFANSPFSKLTKNKYDMCYFSKLYEMFALGKEQGVFKKVSDEILFAYTFYPAAQLAKRELCCGTKLCPTGVDNACMIAWDAVSEHQELIKCEKLSMNVEDRLVNIFRMGEKDSEKLGVEFEHFLIDTKTLRSYNYHETNGQHFIMKKLIEGGWKVDYEEEGNIFAASKDGDAISFEPGGQFEISIRPCSSVSDVDLAYKAIMSEINEHLLEDQALVSLGYHPKSKIDELPLLPKERYKFMYEYLHKHGEMARNMMKGTASTQVSIDYKSEKDFIQKYRVANYLSPFIARLFDASPIFEGEIYNNKNLRINIWEHTDISRCKLPTGALDKSYGYSDYANYILNIKPILMPSDEGIRYTEDRTVGMLAKSNYLTDQELEHAITMVFPDVRLKNFIEIRIADALPYPYNLAVPALVKGIFYNASNLKKYYDYSLSFSDEDFVVLNRKLKETYDVSFMCDNLEITCETFIETMIEDAINAVDKEEKIYLKNMLSMFKEHGSINNLLTENIENDMFLEMIKGAF